LRHQPIDLFTQDFMRPDLNGLELLQMLKSDAALRDMPVLVSPPDHMIRELKK